MMRQLISDFVRSLGVKVVLTQKVLSGVLDTVYYNWVGIDEKYYSLLVACNDTAIFIKSGTAFRLSSFDTATTLQEALRCFESKEEWLNGKWTLQEATGFCEAIRQQLEVARTRSVEVGCYSLVREKFWVRPTVGISVFYKAGKFTNVLNFWYGSKTTISTNDEQFFKFIEKLGYSDYVEVLPVSTQTDLQCVAPVESCDVF